jgi:16S rRNA (adenine1518-N6/adenine1519-N6)-dimethyltransferase
LHNNPDINISKENIIDAIEKISLPANVRGEALTLNDFATLSNLLNDI